MKKHVTVVPSDHVIIVDEAALFFDFEAPADLHALQWHDGEGHIEFTDDLNHPLTKQDYAEDVLPFVQLWEEERAKREDEANKPPTLQAQIATFMSTIQHRLDSFAQTRQYDNSRACVAVYLGCADETFAAEAAYMQQAIVRTWQFSNNYINQVLTGQKEIPTWEQFETELDGSVPLEWPVPDTRVTAA